MLYLYRATTILVLCLFSSACCFWKCTPPNPPKWVTTEIPPYGEKNAAIGCSTHINTPEQRNEAMNFALHKLAGQLGGVAVQGSSHSEIEEDEGTHQITGSTKLEIKVGTGTTVYAVPHKTWVDPHGNKSCVWMETTD